MSPEGKYGILLAICFAELSDGVAEAEHLGNIQRKQSDALLQTAFIVLVVEESVPIYLCKNAWFEEYAVLVSPDDIETMIDSAQTESPVANAIEYACELLFVVGKVYRRPDIVVALLAPIVQFITKDPGISLADEHIFILLEAQIERFREAEVAIVGNGIEITFIEELRSHHTFFAFDNRFVFVKSAVFMRDEDNVVLP